MKKKALLIRNNINNPFINPIDESLRQYHRNLNFFRQIQLTPAAYKQLIEFSRFSQVSTTEILYGKENFSEKGYFPEVTCKIINSELSNYFVSWIETPDSFFIFSKTSKQDLPLWRKILARDLLIDIV